MSIQLPENWKMVKLGDVTKVISGATPKSEVADFWDGDIVWVTPSDLSKHEDIEISASRRSITEAGYKSCSTDLLPIGSVLLSSRAPIGHLAIANTRLCTNQGFKSFIPTDKINSYYLYFALLHAKERMIALGSGATFKEVSKSVVEKFEIPLPPLSTQKTIADVLKDAYALRKLRKQADDKMKELVPALLDEMFGDPFGNERKWSVSSLDDIALDVQYGTSAKANENSDGLPVLRMNNLRYDGSLDLKDLKHTVLQDEELDKYTVQYGDVLINRTNSRELVGKAAVWDKDYAYAFAGYLVRFRLDAKLANPFYVSSALNLPSGKKLLFSMAKPAVNMSNISASDMKRIKLAIPPVELQDKFAEQAKEVVSNQEVISKARQKLDDLFNSLMYRCMSGQIS